MPRCSKRENLLIKFFTFFTVRLPQNVFLL
jgi:hypothetical protein